MNDLQQLKHQINELTKFNVIADALKQIASGQMTIKKRQANISRTILDSFRLMTGKMTVKQKGELHIFVSCDQRFCRLFLRPLNDYFFKVMKALNGQVEGYEYLEFSSNDIPTKKVFDKPQIANFLDGVSQYANQIKLEKRNYKAQDSEIRILICGIQSHKIAQSIPEGIEFTKRRSIANFEEVYDIATQVLTVEQDGVSQQTQAYHEIYLHAHTADGIVSYKSGFSCSLQPVAHLAQEIYFYASAASAKENEVRMTVMSEAADNSIKEVQKTKSRFNQRRQAAITAAIMLTS